MESVELCQLDAKDTVFVKELLVDFSEKTGSEVAQAILDDFENLGTKLTKVFPCEYQRHSIYFSTVTHCAFSSNLFHGHIVLKYIEQMSPPENKKCSPGKVFGIKPPSNPWTFEQERP